MNRRVTWRTPDISADGLKIFACIVMLIQSIGIVIIEKGIINLNQYTQQSLSDAMAADSQLMFLAGMGSVMQLIGGMAVPIFAFLLVEGFKNTSDYKKYLTTMFLFALISEIPFDLAMSQIFLDFSRQNPLFAMTICLLMLYFLRMMENRGHFYYKIYQAVIVLCAVLWTQIFRIEYGLCLVLLTAVFYLFYTRNVLKTVLGVLISFLYVTAPLSFYGIWCYDETRKDILPKYVYYMFYPIHLLVLGLIVKFLM